MMEINYNPMLGRINAGRLIAVYVPFIILTPFYCYYMAVKHDEEKPYPAATITQTACHYPQDIVFRYYMLIASSLLALIFFVIFKWVHQAATQAGYPRGLSSGLYYLAQFSILLYGITIGTIDGKSTGPLHSPCAVVFFVVLIIAIVTITVFLTDLHEYDTRAIGLGSLRLKQLLTVILLAVWAYCLVMLIAVSEEEELQGKGDKYVVIVEWFTVTVGLLWVLSWYFEWEHFYLCLTPPKMTPHPADQPQNPMMLEKDAFYQHRETIYDSQ
jgi:hypothetical protein